MSNEQDPAAQAQIYRVNRLGREVFNGPLPAFEEAIKQQRIRPDDLIFDETLNNWTFARNNEIFMRLSGEGFDELKKNRHTTKKSIPFSQILISVLVLSALLYILMNYSKNIQFKQREGSFDITDTRETQDARKPGDQGASDQGDGEGSGSGSGSGADGLGEASLSELDEENRAAKDLNGEPLEMVFDLEAEGLKERDIIELTRNQKALTDERLLARANAIYVADEPGRHGLNRLLEAISYVEFVIRRARSRDGKDHAEAKLTLSHLNERFITRCETLYAPKVCALKVEHPSWTDGTIKAIVARDVLVGMSRTQAELAWGRPSKIVRVEVAHESALELCFDSKCERALRVSEGAVIEVRR